MTLFFDGVNESLVAKMYCYKYSEFLLENDLNGDMCYSIIVCKRFQFSENKTKGVAVI